MQSTSLEDEIKRANEAQRLLENPLLREALQVIYDEARKAWEETNINEPQKREQIWLMLKQAKRVELHLKAVMETGKLARTTIQQMSKAAAGQSTLLD